METLIFILLGIAGIRTRNFTLASEHLELAIQTYRKMGYRRGEALGLFYLSEFFLLNGSIKDALEFSLESQVIYTEIGDKVGETRSFFQQARILLKSGSAGNVLQELERCRFQFSALDDEYQVGLTFMSMAEAFALSEKSTDAILSVLQEAEGIFRKHGNIVELIRCLCLQGNLGTHKEVQANSCRNRGQVTNNKHLSSNTDILDQVTGLISKYNITCDCLFDEEIDKLRRRVLD